LVENQLIYDLPSDCLVVNRLEYNHKFFPIESRNAIDRGEALFPCALKDNLPFNKLEIVLDASFSTEGLADILEETFGVVSDWENCNLEDQYGVVSDIETGETPKELGAIHVYYSAVPPMITGINEPLVLPDAYFSAFMHYVTGMALQDDNDANNIQRGEMELQKYERVALQIFKRTAKDYTSNIKSKLIMPRSI
jgi:hypothetical protein